MKPDTATKIEFRSVDVQFASGPKVLDSLSQALPAGRITAVLGPSGCGKSTLLRVLAGLVEPTGGSLAFSRGAESRSLRAGELAYVFQDAALLPWRTVMQNVCLPMELLSLHSKKERQERAGKQLEDVGLEASQWGKKPHQLSGGMRMRVSLARALVTDPAVLLLDEPFAALDDLLRERMGQLVLQLWRERPRTIILVTHNIAEALMLSDMVLVMGRGRIVQQIDVELERAQSDSIRDSGPFMALYQRAAAALRSSGPSADEIEPIPSWTLDQDAALSGSKRNRSAGGNR